MSELVLIVAVGKNNVIGRDGDMPWRLEGERIKGDLKRFKNLTVENSVIMGRKTYESIPENYRPLPDRTNIVLSRQRDLSFEDGVFVASSLDDALNIGYGISDKVFCAGGGEIYKLALPFADRIELTEINKDYRGDSFFPEFSLDDWKETSRAEHYDNNPGFSFVTYFRNEVA